MSSEVFCPYHPRSVAEFHCSECNTPMCGLCNVSKAGEAPLCRQCEVLMDENASKNDESSLEFRQEKQREAEEQFIKKIEKPRKQKILLQISVIVLAIVIASFQFLRMDTNYQDYEVNTLDEYEIADECIQLLFDIGDSLEQGGLLTDNLTCPGSNEILIVNRAQDNVVVSVPNPERYGFSEMSVSLIQPIPTLIDL